MSDNPTTFCFEIPIDSPEDLEALQKTMDAIQDETVNYVRQLANEIDITEACAWDVWYLRTRSRHTPELEEELIRLHKAGTPPNVCEFGCG